MCPLLEGVRCRTMAWGVERMAWGVERMAWGVERMAWGVGWSLPIDMEALGMLEARLCLQQPCLQFFHLPYVYTEY